MKFICSSPYINGSIQSESDSEVDSLNPRVRMKISSQTKVEETHDGALFATSDFHWAIISSN